MTRKILLFILLFTTCMLNAQVVHVGIITDFEKSSVLDSIFQVMILEIDRTTGSSKKPELTSENIIYNTRSLGQARTNYNIISAQVDFVLLVGSVSIKGALDSGFPKPTIGLGVVDPHLQEIPFAEGKSGIPNFSYIWPTKDFEKEIAQFGELFPFRKLAILADVGSALTFNVDNATKAIDSISQALSTSIDIIPITDDVTSSIASLPEDIDAVYLTILYDKGPTEFKLIADELKRRKLPSFSGSKWHVDNGILACISDENGFDQIIRKLSIMVDESLSGGSLGSMPVIVNNKEEFYLNIQTAKAIDFSPPYQILFTANLINEDEQLPTYSLSEIMERALEANLDIKISYKDIELSEQDIRSAKTSVLPTLDLDVTGAQINPERAFALFGSSERSLSGQLTLSQLIYSEEAIAGIKITKYIKKAQEYDTEVDVLNTLLDAYFGYFNVLSSKTNLSIRQENLKNSKTNLELAKIRISAGSASNADLFRWESEVANDKQATIEAQTSLITAKLQLNTFLSNSLEDEFDINDVGIDDDVYKKFSASPISNFVKTPRDFKLVTDFMVEESLNYNPNKKFLLENIKATEREKLQNDRLLYIPQVAIQAQTSQVLSRGGEGSTEIPSIPFQDNSWQLGLSLNYPLFRGNGRRINIQRSQVQLQQLDYSKQDLDQQLELSVRANTLQLLNTSTNIAFSNISADNAQRNYELVQENYRQGQVTITQLIDAQQSALQANLAYALSIYDYMQAQLQLEYAMGFFSMFSTADQLTDFQNRFIQFTTNR